MQNVRLSNIPPEVQKMYSIGSEVEAKADNGVMGGHFTLVNNAGHEIGIDAVELSGTDIMIEELP